MTTTGATGPASNEGAYRVVTGGTAATAGIVAALTAKHGQAEGIKREMPPAECSFAPKVVVPVAATVTTSAANAVAGRMPPNIADFFSRIVVWPSPTVPGFINLHYKNPNHGGMGGRPFNDLSQFLSVILWCNAHPGFVSDVYFCLSQQAKTGMTKDGRRVTAARSAQDAQALNALWIDLDGNKTDPKKGYPTLEAALKAFKAWLKASGMPLPTFMICSGGGYHIYWVSDKPLTPDEWRQYAEGLWTLIQRHGLKADPVTTDAARILRVPGTLNFKSQTPKPVTIELAQPQDIDFEKTLGWIKVAVPHTHQSLPRGNVISDPALFPKKQLSNEPDNLGAGLDATAPLDWKTVAEECPHYREALVHGGRGHNQGLWMLTVLGATWFADARQFTHRLSNKHATYTVADCDDMFDRKLRDREDMRLGWPSCKSFENNGCKVCATCKHFGKIKSPLNLALSQQTPCTHASPQQSPPLQPTFVDPYAEFAGPPFPVDVLPPVLSKFVDAEHRATGADPSAIAMAALTTVAGAMHAETRVVAGEGWFERPIFWTTLVGQPSTMKSPIIEKTTKPLIRIDHERMKLWHQDYAKWKQLPKLMQNKTPPPPRPVRCIVKDATPEKVAEILSRDPSGSLMVHDELAGWIGGFDRYNSGQSSRAFYLTCWSGGPYTQDRVGKGKRDADAEIHVDNLALCVLGGIQPDRLAELHDLTSDGLLQRFLPVLMAPAQRSDEYCPVAQAEADYEKLIKAINNAPAQNYHFEDDAREVRDRVIDYLFKLEMVDAFSPALIGAIGKLKGYFARICLVLHAAMEHDPISRNERRLEVCPSPERFTSECRDHIRKLIGLDPNVPDNLGAGLGSSMAISRPTAEAAAKVLRQFLLPHIVGLYDVVANGGQDRDQLRSIGGFILASNKDRLRQSDLTSGVRALRGQPEHKIREWAGRFCAMGWLQPADEKPGVPPKAWMVVPGLREHFAEHRKQAQEARAETHAILKAGGSRRPA